jgi:FtsZ-binding cell division protein ZapB
VQLSEAVRQKKKLQAERDEILKANEDLFRESQRLSNDEAEWEKV